MKKSVKYNFSKLKESPAFFFFTINYRELRLDFGSKKYFYKEADCLQRETETLINIKKFSLGTK